MTKVRSKQTLLAKIIYNLKERANDPENKNRLPAGGFDTFGKET
jgi:hypothetical protein